MSESDIRPGLLDVVNKQKTKTQETSLTVPVWDARVYALEFASRALEMTGRVPSDMVTEQAEDFEKWLLRPVEGYEQG